MKTLTILVTMCFAVSSSPTVEVSNDLRQVKYSEIFKLAKLENKMVMLYFHFEGCRGCKKMEKKVFGVEGVIDYYNDYFVSFAVNTMTNEGKEISERYGVYEHPTFVYLTSDGKVIHKILGAHNVEDIILEGQYARDPIHGLIRKVTGRHKLFQ